MSEGLREPAGSSTGAGTLDEAPASAPPLPLAPPSWRAAAIALAGALVLVVALIATAPLWAPLLPWAAVPAATDRSDARQYGDRIEHLAAVQSEANKRAAQFSATTEAALRQLDRRIAALEAKPGAVAGDLADLRGQVAKLGESAVDLGSRVDALDKAVHAHATAAGATATDTSDLAVGLAVLPIGEAIAAGRPFAEQYDALAALAHNRPEIAQAAQPLAEASKTGVATSLMLADGLRRLEADLSERRAQQQHQSEAVPPPRDWMDAMLGRLRSLVIIRRIDGGPTATAAAGGAVAAPDSAIVAVADARRAMDAGDLAGAVKTLDGLSGPAAAAAAPWLRQARQRLSAEAAVERIEALAAARLGATLGAAQGGSASAGPPR